MKSKKVLICAAVAAMCAGPVLAQTAAPAEGKFMVRARAVHLDSANTDGTGLDLSINNKWLPEVDVSYFLTNNWAAELILTVPQKQSVYAGGDRIGSLRHLPPTLLVQYHFTNFSGFKPYVGAGINYTRFSSVHLLGGAADVERNSFGPALQVGVDIPVAKNVYLNLDLKKVWIKTKVSAGGAELGTFKVDPVLFGVGVGYRF
ncbi:MAG: OmpW family outer membrane protein [Burkholderiaceae bacterium]